MLKKKSKDILNQRSAQEKVVFVIVFVLFVFACSAEMML